MYRPRTPTGEPYATPLRFPRVKILGNVTGEVSLLHDVTLLDLSKGGAPPEHAGRFALNAICYLRMPVAEGELILKIRVVHSALSRTVPRTAEEVGDPLHLSNAKFSGPRLC